MFRTALLFIACLLIKASTAQFYFQDIVNAKNTSENYSLLKQNKVKRVTVTSIEPDGSETEGFGIEQVLNAARGELITATSSGMTGSSLLTTSFNKNNYPVKLVDSSNFTVNTISYTYNDSGKLTYLSSFSHEPGDTNNYSLREDHIYHYGPNGQLTGMLKVKDLHDTTHVKFVPAENGLPGEEQWFKNGRKIENWYYYYDDEKRLTDIVRYNAIAKKLLPDYVFEYEDNGQLAQQTVVLPGTNFYRLWLYDYKENGLKKSETIFNKGKQQEGRIIYEYE